MEKKRWLEIWQRQNQLQQVMDTNADTAKYGLTLREQDAAMLIADRQDSLREQRRIELGPGITKKLIDEFCDSDYIDQGNYVETISRLQDIFYLYKNEMLDEISDDELVHFMREQFETACFGDLDYLEGTCLYNFARAVRAGYDGYAASDGYGQYGKFDEVARWDYDLYLAALRDLCWR